jgi:hypothetical protein
MRHLVGFVAMRISLGVRGQLRWDAAAALLAGTLLVGPASRAADERTGVEVKPVLTEKLPNVPGKSINSVLVTYAPGGKSGSTITQAASSYMCCRARFAPKRRRAAQLKFTERARASSSRPAVSILSARMPARRSQPACLRSLSPMMARN